MKPLRLGAALAGLCLLAACGTASPEASTQWTVRQMAQAVAASQETPELTEVLPGSALYETYLTGGYGLDPDQVQTGAILAAGGASAQEIAVLQLTGAQAAEEAAQALEDYLQHRAGAFAGYLPEEAALLEDACVAVRGSYAALLACGDPAAAQEAFARCFTLDPPETLEPEADIRGAAAPSVSPEEQSGWRYEKERLLEAWEAGDWSGLAPEDQAILNLCREVLSSVVPADGSPYDQELAVHDWMIAHGSYDSNTLSQLPNFQENPNNQNPYGFLVDGKGICLGYTATFQLFMDLLDIPCITVPGTAYGGTEEHAWNQVCLDDAWYCVDVTWDDPVTSGTVSPYTAHQYFNVTSQYMRDTGHQWDESAVPEALGTVWTWSP